ncbi:helix-turn-helix transcriptional regulator [Pseudonocardia humida]|uniref:Helix-turn-helix transcriptional regulator n=1 Tax=Pseudonocardia humida TaxID=2800819 RepID=A0ABT1A1P4_9PSEU|nr:helix-turn-helix transcriptional regulator [Pseudonocardia humida]MCO1656923.1 helix-turn-helix transcriptional regulator [Pseudonocardia humida]
MSRPSGVVHGRTPHGPAQVPPRTASDARPQSSAPAGPEAAVAGSPLAQRLVREAVAGSAALRRVDVVGSGGTGKTVLLDVLAAAFQVAGTTVRREVPGPDLDALPAGTALLVDDAHLLDPDTLARLTRLATGREGHMVVAHRPWPRPVGSAALGVALAAARPPVVLAELDERGVAARAVRLLAERGLERVATDELARRVHHRTAGMPALVDRLLEALADQPGDRARGLSADPPAGLLVQLGYAVQGEGQDVADLLLAVALGAPLETEVLVPLLGLPEEEGGARLDALLERARAAGLLTMEGRAIPLVSTAVLTRTPPAAQLEVRRALAEIELNRGGSLLAVARGLLGTGAAGARVAEVYSAAAEEAVRTGAPGAGELLEAAVAAGAPAVDLAGRRAEVAVLQGDLDLALTQADLVLSAADDVAPADVVRAGTVAAAVLARRGMLARSAEVYRWLGSASMGSAAVSAVPALIGTGALEEAREVLRGPVPAPGRPTRPPTLLAGAEELMAQGVYDSVAGSPTAALSQLTRAASLLESSHRAPLLPDTPAALAALVAVHCGELDVAQSVLDRAVRVELGGRSAVLRHRLLLGWIALMRGATPAARAALTACGTDLEPRDEFLAAALEVALARRTGDLASLMPAWSRAREAIVRHPVDLFVLQQLGELSIAATRLREASWVRPHLDEAAALLDRLGNPALWAASLHWSALQAAILAEDAEAAAQHAAAVQAAAGGSRYAAAMAAAAPHWVRLLASEVDAEGVEAAARGLHAVGLTWDGGKLAGQAAIRTRDRKAMSDLLGCARALQSSGPPTRPAPTGGDVADQAGPGPVPGPARSEPVDAAPEGEGPLSDREREVAALVLEGMTYKQIGEQLFISAKTVEHHVARMRQRLGSGSRGELFAHLRQIVGSGEG